MPRDESARSLGSSYGEGWYGYVDKDLRRLRGRRVQGTVPERASADRACSPPAARHCGRRSTPPARELATAQGPNPNAWRADATGERITFEPGLLGARHKMRWTNRPTFQQVIYFRGHREMTRGLRSAVRGHSRRSPSGAFVLLFVLSEQTDDWFSWTIQPPLTAAFLGASYLAALRPVRLDGASRRLGGRLRPRSCRCR